MFLLEKNKWTGTKTKGRGLSSSKGLGLFRVGDIFHEFSQIKIALKQLCGAT